MADVKPTRSEYLNLKRKIKLAKNGHSLLKKKRDGLIMEFFEILKEAKSLRGEMIDLYNEAYGKMNVARAIESELFLKSVALGSTDGLKVESSTKNIMGIKVPKIDMTKEIKKNYTESGAGIVSGSIIVDEAAKKYTDLISKAVKVAEVEVTMKKLLTEIEKTKRRVNALEFAVIPQMEEVKNFIALRLEEMEREGTIGLKHIKRKKQEA